MTETYTRTHTANKVPGKLAPDTIRLDVDDQLFYEMLRDELDALLHQPQSGIINEITSYSRTHRTPLI